MPGTPTCLPLRSSAPRYARVRACVRYNGIGCFPSLPHPLTQPFPAPYRCSPAGSKPANTYWYQFTRTGYQAVCTGSPQKSFAFDTTQGQSGSPFWTQNDNNVRFVLSYYNSGLAITPASFSWISNFEAVSRG